MVDSKMTEIYKMLRKMISLDRLDRIVNLAFERGYYKGRKSRDRELLMKDVEIKRLEEEIENLQERVDEIIYRLNMALAEQ